MRDFQITDVSKDSITLKDMSNVTDTSSVRAMKRTSVSNSIKEFCRYPFRQSEDSTG